MLRPPVPGLERRVGEAYQAISEVLEGISIDLILVNDGSDKGVTTEAPKPFRQPIFSGQSSQAAFKRATGGGDLAARCLFFSNEWQDHPSGRD